MTDEADEWIEWRARLDRLHFDTTVYLDPDEYGSAAEEVAHQRLIEALESGEATPTWKTAARTRDDIRAAAEMDRALACDRCSTVTQAEKREIRVDGEIEAVCPRCARRLENEGRTEPADD